MEIDFDLKGCKVLITGASGDIGRSIAYAFKTKGASVVLHCNMSYKKTIKFGNELGAQVVCADLSIPKQADYLWKKTCGLFGEPPHILINNAANSEANLVSNTTDQEWDRVINLNLNGLFFITQCAIRSWRKSSTEKSFSIINIGAAASIKGLIGASSYCASKAGIIGLSKSLAREIARYNIRINTVSPGFVDGGMLYKIPLKYRERYLNEIPLKRFAKLEEITFFVMLLSSPISEYVTGDNWIIDGGWTC